MPDEHKITKSRLVTVLSVGLIDRFRKMGRRNRAHSAGERHSGLSQGASQVVLGIAVVPGKTRASQADDSFGLSRRHVHGEQFSSEPKIDDAPVDVGKTMVNTPTLQPSSIDTRRTLSCYRGGIAEVQGRRDHPGREIRRRSGYGLGGGRMQQILSSAGQDSACVNYSDPGSKTGGGATLGLLVGEA